MFLVTMGFSSGSDIDYYDYGYGGRTKDNLFEYHLLPLKSLTTQELIWGYGYEIRKMRWLLFSSDIGYVKQIFEVGIVGVVLMAYFSILMAVRTYFRHKKVKHNMDFKIGSQLMSVLLLVYIFFNYKNQLLYNVCIFEVFLFVYYYYNCYFIKLNGNLKRVVSHHEIS